MLKGFLAAPTVERVTKWKRAMSALLDALSCFEVAISHW